ncbi:MAG TPA: phospholipid carrier-dependent glycosyltransferase [Desulfuromonadales bacterium]|nr:phospholipid carrier-dependent glycosyltransferase [Desulfuromonadales bacterium]
MKLITDFISRKEGGVAADLGILSLIFFTAFFQFLGRFPLIGTDEARYMEIPREMIERGDFITPTLNYVKYFEKPPLHYWCNALAMQLFGETEFAGRFFGALWGVLGILFVYHMGRKLFGRREALLSALILGTSIGIIAQARINITDTTLTICMTACLGCFLLAVQENEQNKGRYYYLFYIFSALAVLAKGLIGIVLPGGVIFCFILITRRWRLLREMRLLTGIMLFLIVCAPWFVIVSIRNPEFARFFFIHEHFERFLTKVHGRYQPPWFFIPILFGVMLPWSFFIPTAIARFWQERKQTGADNRLFLFLWAAVIFVFFSKSDSKLIPYILPVYPAVALLLGITFAAAFDRGFSSLKIPALLLSAVTIVLGVGCIAYPHLASDPKITAGGGIIMGGLFFSLGVVALFNTTRDKTAPLFAGLAIMALLVGIFAPPTIYARMAKDRSARELALIVKEKADKNAIVAVFDYEQGLPFYARRRVVVVGGRNELEFGSRLGDQSAWFIEPEKYAQLWAGPAQVFTLINLQELENFSKTSSPPPILLGKSGRRALITNR